MKYRIVKQTYWNKTHNRRETFYYVDKKGIHGFWTYVHGGFNTIAEARVFISSGCLEETSETVDVIDWKEKIRGN